MNNLNLLDNMQNGFFSGFLTFISIVAIAAGVMIIIIKNPIVSVLYLILLFSSISVYLIFIGVTFIGISYLLVYVGAVSILFLFILMLINIRISELISDTNNNIPLAILVFLAFFIPIGNILPDSEHSFNISNILTTKGTFVKHDIVSYVTSNN
jgi:NADH-ubiquinone oxidoreductase chain 6